MFTEADLQSDQPIVALLQGPNLNLLGQRQPEVYGTATLADHVATARNEAARLGIRLIDFQTNAESEMVSTIHLCRRGVGGIVINPGAFTLYSWAVHDALAAFDGPVIELRISNPAARESFRHLSVVASVASGTIAGFGGDGYRLALSAMSALL